MGLRKYIASFLKYVAKCPSPGLRCVFRVRVSIALGILGLTFVSAVVFTVHVCPVWALKVDKTHEISVQARWSAMPNLVYGNKLASYIQCQTAQPSFNIFRSWSGRPSSHSSISTSNPSFLTIITNQESTAAREARGRDGRSGG